MPVFLQHLGRWLRQHPLAAVVLAACASGVIYWQLTPAPRSRPAGTSGTAVAYQGTLPPRASLEAAMAELEQALKGEDAQLIEKLTEQLNDQSREFAARRMDAGIKTALAGKQVDTVGEKL